MGSMRQRDMNAAIFVINAAAIDTLEDQVITWAAGARILGTGSLHWVEGTQWTGQGRDGATSRAVVAAGAGCKRDHMGS